MWAFTPCSGYVRGGAMIRICALLALVVGLLCAGGAPAMAQQAGKKEFELHGKVEKVDAKTNRLTVDHETVEGWMKAMKMIYKVDKEEVLKDLKPGDQITAKVYEGDFETLYSVQRMPAKAEAETPRK
jgi:Cu/Ag efflux protein CusF